MGDITARCFVQQFLEDGVSLVFSLNTAIILGSIGTRPQYKYMEHRLSRTFLLSPPLLHTRLLHLHPNPTLSIKRNVRLDPNFFTRLPAIPPHPRHRRLGLRIRIHIQHNRFERLRNLHYHDRRFVVCELLAQTDTRTTTEGEENGWVGYEVFLDSLVQKTVRVVFERCG